MEIKMFDNDTFCTTVFTGNPAKVFILDSWLPDKILRSIAEENNLSEVAFTIPFDDHYKIRWFNRNGEELLCGHGTLAAAHVVNKFFNHSKSKKIIFKTTFYGDIIVTPTENDNYQISMPIIASEKIDFGSFAFHDSINIQPKNIYKGIDYLLEYESEDQLRLLHIDANAIKNIDTRGIIATAPSNNFDCISRCFYPNGMVFEDPVTGSAHCMIVPFWADKLQKKQIIAMQYSDEYSRSGIIKSKLLKDSVELTGKVITFLQGKFYLSDGV